MRKKFCILIIELIICVAGKPQALHYPIQISAASLGAYSKNFTDVFSFTNNPAILPSQKKLAAGFYSERRFALKELSFHSLVATLPVKSDLFGLELNHFGFTDYNESKLGIAYGKKLGSLIDIGIQFDYNLFHIAGYKDVSVINGELGIVLHPSEKINIGMHIFNPFGGKINTKERLASIVCFGVGYEASEQVCIHAEIKKEENVPVYINAGLRYAFAKQFFAGIGIETSSASPYACAGFFWKNIRMDIGTAYHLQIGFTPSLRLLFEFANKEQGKRQPS
ncbi:MAG: hypothetical protein JST75_15055 [Bacteroidetes bacterium]|nr:hypothetical protein [Bacteroidota bacterium]